MKFSTIHDFKLTVSNISYNIVRNILKYKHFLKYEKELQIKKKKILTYWMHIAIIIHVARCGKMVELV